MPPQPEVVGGLKLVAHIEAWGRANHLTAGPGEVSWPDDDESTSRNRNHQQGRNKEPYRSHFISMS
jgi:hypothetical protein